MSPLPTWPFKWLSSNDAVASVDANGVIRGLAPGSATIRAFANDQIGETIVTVIAAPSTTLPSFSVVPGSRTHVTLQPVGSLKPGTSYTAVFCHVFTDTKVVRHECENVWSFTTASQ